MRAFIATYRSFTTPFELLAKLIQRYRAPQGRTVEGGIDTLHLRVYVVLRHWISTTPTDFSNPVRLLYES
jgi:hypothetical protein